jgi:flagellar L-ring protein FlgH
MSPSFKNKQLLKSVFCIISFIFLAGCNTDMLGPTPGDPRFAPTYPDPQIPKSKRNGTIYQENQGISLYKDRLAQNVGDILTIRLEETTSAQKNANTKNSKTDLNNFDAPTLFGHPLKELAFKTSSNLSFDSKGQSAQNNTLQGNITVSVSHVLPNGNLAIQGESWITINRGSEYVRLTGLVRRDDIDINNSVSSKRVANARIAYSGTGQLANSNKQGIFSRFFSAAGGY